jgi:hypothetical protein
MTWFFGAHKQLHSNPAKERRAPEAYAGAAAKKGSAAAQPGTGNRKANRDMGQQCTHS